MTDATPLPSPVPDLPHFGLDEKDRRQIVMAFIDGRLVDREAIREVAIVFDGPPGPTSGRFIEVEDAKTGESINLGKWHEIDGLWYLSFAASLGDTR